MCMVVLSIPLTILTMIMIGITLVVTKIAGLSGSYFLSQQRDLAKVNGQIEEMMNGQKVVKVFCHEQASLEEFNKMNEELFESANNANTFANILMPINAQLGNISYVFCAMAGGVLALQGFAGFTLAKLVSFLTFNKSFSQPINQISQQINAIVMALAGADRIFKLLDQEPEVDEGYVQLVNVTEQDGQIKESEKQTGLWAWKHYHQDDGTTTYRKLKVMLYLMMLILDIMMRRSFCIISRSMQNRQKIAFVGATGAGKTTITNLINRFSDIQDGKIRFDGININKIHKKDLRRSLGIVLQDTHLFTGTVMDNIRYGKLDATDDEVIAQQMHTAGYRTMITRGSETVVSKIHRHLFWTRQRVIDTRTEKLVQVDRLMKGRTTFVIAHVCRCHR